MKLTILLLLILCLFSSNAYAQQQMTLTTYYPSPYGAYDMIRLFPRTALAGACQEGTLYVEDQNPIYRLKYCSSGTWDNVTDWINYWETSTDGLNLYPIDNTVRVGIGTSTPDAAAKLHVDNGAILGRGVAETSPNAPTNAATTGEYLTYYTGASNWGGIGAYTSGGMWLRGQEFRFWTPATSNPTNQVLIDSTGNLVVGTTAAIDNKLEVGGSMEIEVDNADSKLRFNDPGDNQYSMGIDRSDAGKFKINAGANIGDANHFTMTSGGVVGIGTANPAGLLTVSPGNNNNVFTVNNDANIGIEMRSGTTLGTPYIDFANDIGSDFDIRIVLAGDDTLSVQGGNLSVNTASSFEALTVGGNLSLRADGTNYGPLRVGYVSGGSAGYYVTYAP